MSFEEKPKNDHPVYPRRTFDDSSYQQPIRERPQGVAIFLGALVLWSMFRVFVLITSLEQLTEGLNQQGRNIVEFALYIDIALTVFGLVGIWAVWNWKKWGFQALVVVFGLTAIFSLCGGNIIAVIVNGGIIFLMYKIIGDINHLLE